MAILSFKKQFAAPILKKQKVQTIRGNRKYPIFPGERLYLYTGLRTNHTKKIGEAECIGTLKITIKKSSVTIHSGSTKAEFERYQDLQTFAKEDGFKSWENLVEFWIDEHGHDCFPFTGTLICFKLLPKSKWGNVTAKQRKDLRAQFV